MKNIYCRVFCTWLAAMVMLVLMTQNALGQAVSRSDVDRIRRGDKISDQDAKILEKYLISQFDLIKAADDVSKLKLPVKELLDISSSASATAETIIQYSTIYSSAIKARYLEIITIADGLMAQENPASKQLASQLKLAVITPMAFCDNISVIDDLITFLKDPLEEVRYWAARGLSMPNIQTQLAKADASDSQVQKVLNALNSAADQENFPEVLYQIVLAANLKAKPLGVTIMQKCVTKRLAPYKAWQVTNETVDLEIIRQLTSGAERELAANNKKAATELIRSASELYITAYLRFVTGRAYPLAEKKSLNLLSEQSQISLTSLLIVAEQEFVRISNKALSVPRNQSLFLSALRENPNDLKAAYDSLFAKDGILNQAFGILDGWNPPAELPKPSDEILKKAQIKYKIGSFPHP